MKKSNAERVLPVLAATKRAVRCVIVLLIMGLVTGKAQALIIEYSLPELVQASDLIVRGQVIKTECHWGSPSGAPDGRIIVTDVTMIAEELFKGTLDTVAFTVRTDGGVIDTIGLWVEDQPRFRVGQEAIVFLGAEADDGVRRVTNLFNGKYTIADEVIRENGLLVSRFEDSVRQAVRDAEARNER